jgi:hypothetical protein
MKRINKMTRMLILSLLSLTLLFSACKKDKSDALLSKTSLLTHSTWKMTAATVDPGYPTFDDQFNITGSTTDYYSTMEDCSKDDTYHFNADKTMIIDDNALKCDNSDPQKVTGTWSFNPDETVLTSIMNGDLLDFNLMELTDNVLRLEYTESFGFGTYTYILTFSH